MSYLGEVPNSHIRNVLFLEGPGVSPAPYRHGQPAPALTVRLRRPVRCRSASPPVGGPGRATAGQMAPRGGQGHPRHSPGLTGGHALGGDGEGPLSPAPAGGAAPQAAPARSSSPSSSALCCSSSSLTALRDNGLTTSVVPMPVTMGGTAVSAPAAMAPERAGAVASSATTGSRSLSCCAWRWGHR